MVAPYAVLKRFAQMRGQSIEKYLALYRRNDPFYMGTPSHYRQAQWIKWIYRLVGSPVPVHVRRLHYLAVSRPDICRPDGTAYTNSPRNWDLMHHSCKYARYLDLIPYEVFEDRRNAQPVIFSEAGQCKKNISAQRWMQMMLAQLSERVAAGLVGPRQRYYVEVWTEKSSVLDEVLPVARKYMVNVVCSLGEMSLTAVVALVERVLCRAQPTRIFYISDFDPAGRGMPLSVSRKLEYLLRRQRTHPQVKLCNLMLTSKQCGRYHLPRTPISRSNRRKARFECHHGLGATELDALAALCPGTISRLLAQALGSYCSLELARQVSDETQSIIRELAPKLQERLKRWIPVLGTCQELKRNPPNPAITTWLYDSARDYVSQLAAYKRHLDFTSEPRPEDQPAQALAQSNPNTKRISASGTYKKLGEDF